MLRCFQFLLLKAFAGVSINVRDQNFTRFITFPRIIIGSWIWNLFERWCYTSCFFKKLSSRILFIVLVFCHSGWKFKCKSIDWRSEFTNHEKLWLLLIVFNDGNDVNSIGLARFWSGSKHFLILFNCVLSDWKIYVFHTEPFPSVYLSLFNHLALYVWLCSHWYY